MALRYPAKFDNNMPFIHFSSWKYNCPLPNLAYIDNNNPRDKGKYPKIALYMPGEFTESSNTTWSQEDVLQGSGGSVVSNTLANIKAKMSGNKIITSVESGFASVPFPTDIAIFQKVDPLGFTLNFNMIPYNSTEAENIKEICNAFKKALMPSVQSTTSVVLTFPEVWDVEFVDIKGIGYDDKSTFQNMALTNCSVSYVSGTEGASVYADKNPTQTKLSLTFQSIRKYFNIG